jgi:hypothetical protein
MFMGATEEQMQLLTSAHITHVSYILVLFSFAFLLFLFVHMLLHLYAINSAPLPPPKDIEMPVLGRVRSNRMGGHRLTDSRQIRDAEEFELHGLISDDEGEGHDNGLESPSTLGKNEQLRAD